MSHLSKTNVKTLCGSPVLMQNTDFWVEEMFQLLLEGAMTTANLTNHSISAGSMVSLVRSLTNAIRFTHNSVIQQSPIEISATKQVYLDTIITHLQDNSQGI